MGEWLTYSLGDFLLFSEEVYRRLFVRLNATYWPAPLIGPALALALIAAATRKEAWAARAGAGALAILWLWVGWAFVWRLYLPINWAAAYLAPLFLLGAAAFVWRAVGPTPAPGRERTRAVGVALLLLAAFYPLLALATGRPIETAEVFAFAPDPTAVGALGFALLGGGARARFLLLAPAIFWCAASALTLAAFGALEGWVVFGAALAALGAPLAERRRR